MGIEIPGLYDSEEISLESLQALGAGLHINGLDLPPLTAGHFVLLDALGNYYARGPGEITEDAVCEAVAVMRYGQDAVQPVTEYLLENTGEWQRLVTKQTEFVTEHNIEAVHEQIGARLEYAMAGFECIQMSDEPQGGDSRFDVMWLARIVSAVMSASPGISYDQCVWHLPLTMIGHFVAVNAETNGTRVQRPIDFEALQQKLQGNIWQENAQN